MNGRTNQLIEMQKCTWWHRWTDCNIAMNTKASARVHWLILWIQFAILIRKWWAIQRVSQTDSNYDFHTSWTSFEKELKGLLCAEFLISSYDIASLWKIASDKWQQEIQCNVQTMHNCIWLFLLLFLRRRCFVNNDRKTYRSVLRRSM